MRLIPRSWTSNNVLNRVSILIVLGCRTVSLETPSLDFFFLTHHSGMGQACRIYFSWSAQWQDGRAFWQSGGNHTQRHSLHSIQDIFFSRLFFSLPWWPIDSRIRLYFQDQKMVFYQKRKWIHRWKLWFTRVELIIRKLLCILKKIKKILIYM
jgi:hypothetical protein